MKKKLAIMLAAAFLAAGAVRAVNAGAATREEKRLERSAGDIDRDSRKPNAEKPIVGRIENQFKVTDAQIAGLRSRKLGYGEITIVFALADKLPGGITGANVDWIMAMRNGPPRMGWGEIAHKLGFKLGPVIKNVETVRSRERRELREEGNATRERMEKGKMGERPVHPEPPERPERPEMRERGGR